MKATKSRILEFVSPGADQESEGEIGELTFVPKGSRVVAKGAQLDNVVVVDEDKGQVVEVLDEVKVQSSSSIIITELYTHCFLVFHYFSHFIFSTSNFRSTKAPLL